MNDLTHINDAFPCGCLRQRSMSFVHGLKDASNGFVEEDEDEDDEDLKLNKERTKI